MPFEPNCKIRDLRFKPNIQANYIPSTLNDAGGRKKERLICFMGLVYGKTLTISRNSTPLEIENASFLQHALRVERKL